MWDAKGVSREASKNKVLKFWKLLSGKRRSFSPPTILGKTLQILLGKYRRVGTSGSSSPPPRSGTVAALLSSASRASLHPSPLPSSQVARPPPRSRPPRVKVGERKHGLPRDRRRAGEDGGGKSGAARRADAGAVATEASEDGNPRVASKLKQLKDVRERPPTPTPPPPPLRSSAELF